MQMCVQKPQHPLQKRALLATAGSGWSLGGRGSSLSPPILADGPHSPPHLPGSHSGATSLSSGPGDLCEPARLPCRGANRDIKAAASHFQEALKHASETVVPGKIKSLPIEESEGLKHQNRVGGLTDIKKWSAIVHQAVEEKSQNKNTWWI